MTHTAFERWKWARFLIPGLYVVLALSYSLVVPAWEAPDENLHFDYAGHLLLHGELPVQQVDKLSEAHQPPLYYMAAALFALPTDVNGEIGAFRANPRFVGAEAGPDVNRALHGTAETFPYRGQALALHLMRLASIAMGMVTVFLTIKIGWELFPRRPQIGVLGAGLVAFNPQFLFISSSVNNDNLLVLAATGVWWQLLHAMKDKQHWRQWLFVGLWLSAAVLAKPSAVVMGLVVGLALVVTYVPRRSWHMLVKGGVAVSAPVILFSGWWFLRNQLLYGDPLGWTVFSDIYRAVLRREPLEWGDIAAFFATQFDSFWGMFGWSSVPAPSWFYLIMRLLTMAGVLGLGAMWLRRRRAMSSRQKTSIGILVLAVVAFEAYMLWAIGRFDETWYQGRYLFPVIAPAMLLLALGLCNLVPARMARLPAIGLPLLMLAASLFLLLAVVRPAFESPPLAKWQVWTMENDNNVIFGDRFRLVGHRLAKSDAGDELRVTLFWQSLRKIEFNYSVFMHLVDVDGLRVAQDDRVPGTTVDFPPKRWWPGDVVAVNHVVPLPEERSAGPYALWVGVYHGETGERLPAFRQGEYVDSYITLDLAKILSE